MKGKLEKLMVLTVVLATGLAGGMANADMVARVDYVQDCDCMIDYKEVEAAAPGTVPNGNFEEIYKPGSVTVIADLGGGWTQGVGPDAPMDTHAPRDKRIAIYSDVTTGDCVDIPGWIGADPQGWIDAGGTYGRDTDFPNRQGSIQGNGVDGSYCYLANGGDWDNSAGGLIVSAVSLGTADPDLTYTLSAFAVNGDGPAATPVVLDLLVDGVAATPDSTVDPVFDATWHKFSRTYSGLPAGEMTIVLGVGRGAEGGQTSFDNVTLSHSPEPLPKGHMAKLVQETKTAVKELAPQEAIAFLEKKIAAYEEWRATNLSDIKLRDKHLSSDIYFLLARAKEAAGAPNRDVIAAYKQSVSQVLHRTNYVPAALLWLFENIPSEEYVNIAKEFVYNTNVLSYNTYQIAKHFESSGNWGAFEHFLDGLFSGVDFRGQPTYAYAEVVAKALEKDGAWSGKFSEYCRSKPQMMEYLFHKHERAASRYIARKNFGKAAKIYRDIISQCGPNQKKAIYEFKLCECLYNDGQYDSAVQELNSFIKNNRASHRILASQALMLKGQACVRLGEIDRATDMFFDLLIEYPESKLVAEANFFVGYCYMLQSRFGEATEAFNLLVQDYPESEFANKARSYVSRIKSMTQ